MELIKCNTLVLKIASRCNLNCTYCYMYNLGDESYKNQPKFMSTLVVEALLQQVKEHCRKTGAPRFSFVFHGGEPLLAPKKFYRDFVRKARLALLPDTQPVFLMQTNGLLLTEEWCQLFTELQISFGISLDGLPADNDKYRIDHAGRGSYSRIVEGLRTAQSYASAHSGAKWPGILSVINVQADPVATYEHLKSLGVRGVDFLFPECTYELPPPLPLNHDPLKEQTPYADWLTQIFDLWLAEPGEIRIDVRLFYYIVHSLLGGVFTADFLGELNNEVLVIETNGGIEAVDALKACGDGFTKAGANVLTHSFVEAMGTPLASLYYSSHQKLPKQCLGCPVREICGGGYLPHRYSHANGFNNPSFYCQDLLKLITHIQNKVLDHLPPALIANAQLSYLSYEEARRILIDNNAFTVEPDYADDLTQFSKADAV